MPLVATESTNTGGLTTSDDTLSTAATRVFTVVATDDDGEPIAETELVALQTCGVEIGTPHPDYNFLICRDIDVKREPNHLGVFRCTFVYRYPDALDPGTGGSEFETAVNLNYRGKFEKLWRVDANPEAEPFTGGSTGEDIGGTPMDTLGEVERTTLIVKPQLQVTLQRNVDIGRNDNYLSRMQNFVGSRNNARFLGADKGKLLFLGATSRRVRDELYEISLSFEFDPAKHQEQAPQPGVGLFGKKITTSGEYKDRAFPVYWIQPYPKLMNFNSLGINLRG